MMTENQLKRDLLEAAEAAVSRESGSSTRRAKLGTPSATRWGLVLGCAAIVILGGGAVLALRPEWIFRTPPSPESPALSEASIRLAMVREKQRVDAHLREHGSLPATMAEAGGRLPGLELHPGPGTGYRLRYGAGTLILELRSTDSLETFLGNSLQEILSRKGKP